VGRQEGNDLQFDDQKVSRQHASIICTASGCQITDLDSSNGTYVDGEKLIPNIASALIPGSAVKIGSYTMQLRQIVVQEEIEKPPEAKPEDEVIPAKEIKQDKPSAQVKKARTRKRSPSGKGKLPPVPPAPSDISVPPDYIPPGLSIHSQKLIQYLPGIYHTEFMARFLGLFETILTPIEWNVENFDLFLNPATAPAAFLPWLAQWFDITFESAWTESQRRSLLKDAHMLYARRGTRWALSRILEILTGYKPTIIDEGDDLPDFTFKVILPLAASQVNREMIERLIDANKPAHTMYSLEFQP
jgi:phage tail-like protein